MPRETLKQQQIAAALMHALGCLVNARLQLSPEESTHDLPEIEEEALAIYFNNNYDEQDSLIGLEETTELTNIRL